MNQGISRRNLLKTTATISAAAAIGAIGTNFAFAQGSDKIRVGLIGCGGRGTGAAGDCCLPNQNVELVAMGDLFKDHLDDSRNKLRDSLKEKFNVTDDRCFVGFDAYKKAIDCLKPCLDEVRNSINLLGG